MPANDILQSRKPIFDAAKKLGAVITTRAHVAILDNAIDEAILGPDVPGSTGVGVEIFVANGLKRPDIFFNALRTSRPLGPELSEQEVSGCNHILEACAKARWGVAWVAYALATAFHETAGTMQPIREYGRGRGRKYGKPGKHGQIAYGRGYVQLTWDFNYETADRELGLNGALISNYELALDHKIAADIMVRGMSEGWFTRKKLADTLPASGPATFEAFRLSRPIINGRDKDRLIAQYAVDIQKALIAGEWV